MGVSPYPKRVQLSVLSRYENGESSNAIAAHTGIPGSTVRHWIRQSGAMRSHSAARRMRDDIITAELRAEISKQLLTTKLAYQDIADDTDVSLSTVNLIAKDIGITTPRDDRGRRHNHRRKNT